MRLNNFKKAFTLIELMVVIAIIGILATAGISMYGTYQAKARDTKRTTNLNNLTVWLQGYYTDKYEFPAEKSANCLYNSTWDVADALKSYYDNKKLPLDPQKGRKAWSCNEAWAPFYLRLSKDGVANVAYILWTNVEVKSWANYLLNTSVKTYEDQTTRIEWANALTDVQRNATSNKQNILYAVVGN